MPRAQRISPTSPLRPTELVGPNDKPDVLLDIPNVSVDEIKLDVENLQAHVSLDGRVPSLVRLTAGVDASIDKVHLEMKGVQATALLIVRLENVREIITKTLDTLNNNPQLVDRLLQSMDNTAGSVANTALQPGGVLSQTINSLGQTITRTVDTAGNLLERRVHSSGRVLSSRTVGRALELPVVRESTNYSGQMVRQVRDASGSLIELTLNGAGQIVNSRVPSGPDDGVSTLAAQPGPAPAPAR